MRGGLRKINVYIENVKRKQVLVKTFKNEILNKILTICEGKNNEKFQLSIQAQELAFTVKKNLVLISLDETEECPKTIEESEKLYNLICEFARNCRRKKSKKVNESDFYSEDSSEKEKKKKKNSINKKKKEYEYENENEHSSQNQQESYQVQLKTDESKFKEQINDSLNENSSAILSKDPNSDIKIELKESDNGIFGAKSDFQINELERTDKKFHIEQPILGSASYNFPIRSNSNYFNFGSINIEASEDWARSSGLLDNKNAVTNFINTVPDVTHKKAEFEGENKKGEFDFSNYNNFPIAPSEFEYIFRKEINLYPIPDVAKSYDLEKSFTFSNSIKESSMFFQGPSETSKLDINLQALFSSSSIPGTPLPMEQLANSSGFSMWSGFGKESQEINLKSTKCDLDENLDEKGE